LALRTAEKIMSQAALFAHHPCKENLVHLRPGQIVGEWRDSTYGMTPSRKRITVPPSKSLQESEAAESRTT
jgi:hypothetical protein